MSFLEGLLWLTLNIYHEARNEPQIGQLAIAHVTLNRAAQQQKSVASVVQEPKQFSWISQKQNYLPTDQNAWVTCLHSAWRAMITKDFTNGALYFHRSDLTPPQWLADKTFLAQYGEHKFYRN